LFFSIFIFDSIHAQTKYPLNLGLEKKRILFGLETNTSKNLPKVTLVLSGGGARGFAQIGIIKALEKHNIDFDMIVGTSMGSIIGGLYSSGYQIDDIDSLLTLTNWESLLSSSDASRNELFLDNKVTEDRAIFSIRFDGTTPVIPTSISSGQRVLNFLNTLTFNAPLKVKNNFSELKNDFYAISTNLVNGNLVLLHSGSLSKSIRASSSVSFFLAPVKFDSLLLADGGLVANVPINIAKDLGADYVLAVNTTSSLKNEKDLESPFGIADQVISIPISIITNNNLKNGDYIIAPNLHGKRNNDFSNLQKLVDYGYNAALPNIESISSQINNVLEDGIFKDLIFFRNFITKENDNQFEARLNKIYASQDSVSSKKIAFDLYSIIDSGYINNYDAYIETDSAGNSHLLFEAEYYPVVKQIFVNGNSEYLNNFCASKLNVLLNKPYNSKLLAVSLLNVLRGFRHKGYSLANYDTAYFKDNTITIAVSEGILDKIIIEGNTQTNDEVILRELPFKPKGIFNINSLEEGLDNLRSANLFDEVDVVLTQHKKENILHIKVLEKLPLVVRFGLKIDNEYYSQFIFDIRNENLGGSGTEIGANILLGPRNRFINIEHKSNRIFNTYLTYKLKGYYLSENISLYRDRTVNQSNFLREKFGEYTQSSLGLSLGIGMQLRKFGSLIFEARFQHDKIDSTLSSSNLYFSKPLALLKTSFSIDTQDRFPFPRKGIALNTYYETAQTFLGSNISYTKFYFDYKSYFSLNNMSTIKAAASIGFGDQTLPLSQQFSFGGQNNFFGYNLFDYRGRQIFITSLEYQYLLPVKLYFDTYLKVRYDLGSVWSNREDIKFKDLRHGMGLSVAFDTPIGPADFSVGKSFLLKKQLPESNIVWGDTFFYLTIGYYY